MPENEDHEAIAELADKVARGLAAVEVAPTVYVPLPDAELNERDGIIGHVDGIAVYTATWLGRTIGDDYMTMTLYTLEGGGVWGVDQWGDRQEWPDLKRDEAWEAERMLEEEGWETGLDYQNVHTRLAEARHSRLVDGNGNRRPLEVGGPYLNEGDALDDAGSWWSRHAPEDQQKAGQARVRERIAETLEAAGVEVSEAEQRIVRILANDDTHGKILQGVVLDWIRRAHRAGVQAGRAEHAARRAAIAAATAALPTMYAEPNEHGRCRACDGTTGVCQRCHKPMHGPEAGHECSALPCRGCNGGSYPVRPATTAAEGQDAEAGR